MEKENKQTVAIKWSRKQIFSLSLANVSSHIWIGALFFRFWNIISKCGVRWAKKFLFFLPLNIAWQSWCVHGSRTGNGICLQNENLSFVTCTIKFMISLTTYFDTLNTKLSSYFYFPLSLSIEILCFYTYACYANAYIWCGHMFRTRFSITKLFTLAFHDIFWLCHCCAAQFGHVFMCNNY